MNWFLKQTDKLKNQWILHIVKVTLELIPSVNIVLWIPYMYFHKLKSKDTRSRKWWIQYGYFANLWVVNILWKTKKTSCYSTDKHDTHISYSLLLMTWRLDCNFIYKRLWMLPVQLIKLIPFANVKNTKPASPLEC